MDCIYGSTGYLQRSVSILLPVIMYYQTEEVEQKQIRNKKVNSRLVCCLLQRLELIHYMVQGKLRAPNAPLEISFIGNDQTVN